MQIPPVDYASLAHSVLIGFCLSLAQTAETARTGVTREGNEAAPWGQGQATALT